MTRPLLTAAAALSIGLAGCGAGDIGSETRSVDRFSAIRAEDGLDVTVSVAAGAPSLRVRGNEDRLGDVEARVENGMLTLSTKDRLVIGWDGGGDPTVEIRVPSLRALEAYDGSDLDVDGVKARRLRVRVEDGADVHVRGSARTLVLSAYDGADAELDELLATRAEVIAEDAADAELNVESRLDVRARDGADVTYSGSPELRTQVEDGADVRPSSPASSSRERR
jgi:hypothetical protein